MPKWEIGETYKTVGGFDAKLIYRKNSRERPLVFVITGRHGTQVIAERDEQGRLLGDKIYDLDVVPPEPDKTSKFINVYQDAVGANFNTYDAARRFGSPDTKGVLEIQFEDGDYSGTVFHPVNKGEDK
jgi:hypothetical protein